MEQEKAEKYNGWTNYETWAIALWIDNDQSSYRYWRQEAARCLRQSADKAEAIRRLAEQLEQEITDDAPTDAPNAYSDLLIAALCEVNWVEIAENWLSEE